MRAAVVFLVFQTMFITPVCAQTATGTISGYVEDTTGARVPNAKVTLVHSATQQSRIVYTNERGEFLSTLLPIGEYGYPPSSPASGGSLCRGTSYGSIKG